jgi:DnaB helicase-like protein
MEQPHHDNTNEPNVGLLFDEAVESDLLGWMLLTTNLAAVAAVPVDIFSTNRNRELAEVMIDLAEHRIAFDAIAVQQALRRRGKEILVGALTEMTCGVVVKRPVEYRI